MTGALGYFDMVLLFLVCLGALAHLNTVHLQWNSPKSLGFAAIVGAAGGRALAHVWPGNHDLLVPWLVLILHGGFATVMLALAAGKLEVWLGVSRIRTFNRDVLELVTHTETPEDLQHLKVVAAAALASGGLDRRTDPAASGFVEKRFHQVV